MTLIVSYTRPVKKRKPQPEGRKQPKGSPGTIVRDRRIVRRNEPCPFCASGKKFKKCHGAPQIAPEGPPMRSAGVAGEKPCQYPAMRLVSALGPIPATRRV